LNKYSFKAIIGGKLKNKIMIIQCPHCKTFFQGGFNRQSLRIACMGCSNPIEIEWDKSISVDGF